MAKKAKTPKKATAAIAAKIDRSKPSLMKVLERAIALSLEKESFGNQRQGDISTVEVDADKGRLNIKKKLLASKELKAIGKLDREARDFLLEEGLPSFFKDGIYLIPTTRLERVDARLAAFAEERAKLVDAFVAAYPQRIAEAAQALRTQFNPEDYPRPEEVRFHFHFSWSYLELGLPQRIQNVSSAVFQAASARAETQMATIVDQLRDVPRAAMAKLVEHLVKSLKPRADGKQPRFHASTLEKLEDFHRLFEHRDMTNDAALQALVAKSRAILKGTDVSVLKDDMSARAAIADQMAEVSNALAAMTTTAPRSIRLG
jgi:hypothetical protein